MNEADIIHQRIQLQIHVELINAMYKRFTTGEDWRLTRQIGKIPFRELQPGLLLRVKLLSHVVSEQMKEEMKDRE